MESASLAASVGPRAVGSVVYCPLQNLYIPPCVPRHDSKAARAAQRGTVFSGSGDAGGCRHSSPLVTRHDVCKLQQFSCPCVVGLVALGSVLGDYWGGGRGGGGKGKAASAKHMGGKTI